jgi:hypothetical protein
LREVRDDAAETASRTASAMGLSRQSLPGAAPLKPIPLNPQRDRAGPTSYLNLITQPTERRWSLWGG